MENIQYSSKPWFMDELGSICFTDPVYGICQICHVPDIDNPEQKVNANLLMSAPDLLAACRDAIDFIWAEMKENPDKEDMDGSIMDRLIELQTGLISVWRKARGGE